MREGVGSLILIFLLWGSLKSPTVRVKSNIHARWFIQECRRPASFEQNSSKLRKTRKSCNGAMV